MACEETEEKDDASMDDVTNWLDNLTLEDGRIICDTWNSVTNALHPIGKGLQDPIPMYPNIDALLKVTVPREILLSRQELETLSDAQLRKYHRAISYWKSLWFMQKFRHFAHHCRTCEIPGQRENQTFWRAPPLSIPVRADVLNFDWPKFQASQMKHGGRMFDVIVTDPPWTLATEKSTRGVALNYDQITDQKLINAVPWYDLLNDNGLIFMWVINAKMVYALGLLKDLGFKILENMSWLKMSQNRLFARGHGFYLQHAKEDCIVATKGDVTDFNWEQYVTAMAAEKRCQSQKPAQFYDMVEAIVPNGYYCEVFARRNNLRNGWVSLGNQL